jgi:predicted ATPase
MVAAIDDLVQRGLLSNDRGAWQLNAPLEAIALEVPHNLEQMIGTLIEGFKPEDQRAFEWGAVMGVAFLPKVVADAAGFDAEEFKELCYRFSRPEYPLRAIAPQQLPDGRMLHRYQVVHGLYREVLYRRVAPSRRARMHQSIGESLERLWSESPDDQASELAYHFENGQDWPRAIKYLRQLAAIAGSRGADRHSGAILQHALDLAGKLPDEQRGETEAELGLKLASTY